MEENEFEMIYQEYKIIKKKFGEDITRDEEVAVAYRELSARLHEKGPVFEIIYCQYEESRDSGNEGLNFYNYLLEADKYAGCLKKNGVKCFTISDRYSGVISMAMAFQKAGYRITGIKEAKGGINPWSGEREVLPALVFEIN